MLGASVSNIMLLLSKELIRLILFAILIAFPIAWWAMHSWLDNFAYHIKIEPWIFALAGVAILIIALMTLRDQSVRTALMNPVKSRRTE